MDKLEIEFFHDIICSFCYPMSYMMRKIVEDVDNIEIIHRSFALIPSDEYFDKAFGSRENAKKEIVSHWEAANNFDELNRFNIKGMLESDIPFPSSMKPLKACKAAFLIGGDKAYWDSFDLLQDGLYKENIDINDLDIIYDMVKSLDIDFNIWKEYFNSEEVDKLIKEDFELCSLYDVNSAPTLIVNKKYGINGIMPYNDLKNKIIELKEREGVK